MINRTTGLFIFILASFLVVTVFEPVCFAVSVDEASVALNKADEDLNSAFIAVADAGNSGADTASLLERLSVAGNYLSDSHIAFRVGNYENAYSSAVACSNSLLGVADEALRLMGSAENSRGTKILLTTVGSGVGLTLLFVFGLFGWRFVSKRYIKRVLDLKPVAEDRQ